MELPTGTIVDAAYRISAPIRLAKDGDVYLGEPIAPGPPVMIHILRTALMEGDPGLEVFERAGRELCKFSHDAFPEVVDFGRFMVRPYIVTEKVDGKTLAQLVDAGELGSDQALRVINETRDALQAAHEEGMAHGAMSADSVLVTEAGQVKILDLFNRWVAQQIHTKGAEADTGADLKALVELSQRMMKGANRTTKVEAAPVVEAQVVAEAQVIAEAPADIASDLDMNALPMKKKKFEADTVDLQQPPNWVVELAEEEESRPQWEEFTPEPEIEMGSPPTVVHAPPEPIAVKAPEPIVVKAPPPIVVKAPPPIVVKSLPPPPPPAEKKPIGGIRLPPPMFTNSTHAKPVFPTPLPKLAPAVRTPIGKPIEVKLPVAPKAPKARLASFVPNAQLDSADDPLVSPQLQPGYIGFFKNLFPRSSLTLKAEGTGRENGASRSINLLLTCSIALVMLAMVLRF